MKWSTDYFSIILMNFDKLVDEEDESPESKILQYFQANHNNVKHINKPTSNC
jgi:hypothetical protein